MIIPQTYFFKLVAGATFDYSFRLMAGGINTTTPQDLTEYTAIWQITSLDGKTVYDTYTNNSIVGNSGVFFGGESYNPTNGQIDLIINAYDSGNLNWTKAAFTLTVSPTPYIVTSILVGQLNVIGTVPNNLINGC
jgi:hypothetical protein